jgi:hypothetical protein
MTFGISGKCANLFKTSGPSMLAGATPTCSPIYTHFRKDNHAGKARKFCTSTDGSASLAGSFVAHLLLSFSVIRNSALQVRLLTHAIALTEFTGLALGRTQ